MVTVKAAARALAVVIATLALLIVLTIVAFRHSLLYWAVLALAVLPVVAWRGRAMWTSCLIAAAIAVGLAASPVDIWLRPFHMAGHGRAGLYVLPTMHGITCQDGFACYGCGKSFHDARQALVVSY
jgi:hypothetical protein